jgi:hypothetical protein
MWICLPRPVLLSGFGSIRLRFVCFRRCIGPSSISKDPHSKFYRSDHVEFDSGDAASGQTLSGTRTSRSVTPHKLHLRQDVQRAARCCQGHSHYDLPNLTRVIIVRTCTKRPDVVRGTHITICHSLHAASVSGRATSGQALSGTSTTCSVTPFLLHLRQDVQQAKYALPICSCASASGCAPSSYYPLFEARERSRQQLHCQLSISRLSLIQSISLKSLAANRFWRFRCSSAFLIVKFRFKSMSPPFIALGALVRRLGPNFASSLEPMRVWNIFLEQANSARFYSTQSLISHLSIWFQLLGISTNRFRLSKVYSSKRVESIQSPFSASLIWPFAVFMCLLSDHRLLNRLCDILVSNLSLFFDAIIKPIRKAQFMH